MHTESERLRALTETYQRNPIESGASRCCLDRFQSNADVVAEIADLGHVHVRELAASDWEGLNSWIRMLTCSAGLPPPALIHNVPVTLPELLWKEKTLHRFIRNLILPARPPRPRP